MLAVREMEMPMFKSLLTGACLLALFAGCASAPQNQAPTAKAANAGPTTGCVTTGSRVPLDQNQCASFGRSYSGEELQQTGHIDTARALQTLDPAITASGGGR
jgi:hypothetical protein